MERGCKHTSHLTTCPSEGSGPALPPWDPQVGCCPCSGLASGVRRGWVWGSELNLTLGRTCLPQRPGLLRSFLLPGPARPRRGPSPGLGSIDAEAWVLLFTCHSLCLLSAGFPREPGPSGLPCVLRSTCSPPRSTVSGAPGLPPPSSILSQKCPVDEFSERGAGGVRQAVGLGSRDRGSGPDQSAAGVLPPRGPGGISFRHQALSDLEES